jgi:hypothetical protein
MNNDTKIVRIGDLRMTKTQFLAFERAVRVNMLGIRDLYKPGHHPRHRPPTVDAALKREEIAQFVGIYRALHPFEDKKESIAAAVNYFGCKRAYVYKAWKQTRPERRKVYRGIASVLRLSGLR